MINLRATSKAETRPELRYRDRRSGRVIGAVLASLLLASPLATAPATAAPAISPPTDGQQGEAEVFDGPGHGTLDQELAPQPVKSPAPEDLGRQPSGSASIAATCVFQQRVDYVHFSTSSLPDKAVQSHGNWYNENCPQYTKGDTTTQIDRKNFIGLFQAVGSPGRAVLAPNPNGLTSGGAGRVTAHYDCNGTATAAFRSWTGVDIVGYDNTDTPAFSPAIDLACG
ncbi:hypothetical protein [Mycetocola zhadangensis]|uniref:DUF3558 domain-containing protein n=1 Tax=Mycetocola zhadangensis TaxID=1164595 RepID=A0A3L7ISG3_9MICO|nr:hypothetical protein [Mycetocola zhadangensis]RLQ81030.1 hypothetical protein D9V28_14870 [Mycetocola zhadangensis]GGF04135.1 hypothetical protein GCM10011313_29030 [Mycetocola zhadangensis]